MNNIMKNLTIVIVLSLVTILDIPLMSYMLVPEAEIDIPLLSIDLVPEAEAVLGVRRRTRRRTAVVAYSAGAATAAAASSSAAATQQQAAPPPQQSVAPPPQQAPPQAVSAVPVGTIVETLPATCTPVTVGNVQYQECGGSFYRTAFQGNSLVYVVVERPL